jgi:AraC-like DNA-binding protein
MAVDDFGPVLEQEVSLGRDVIYTGITEDAHELSRQWAGDTHSHARFEAHILLSGRCRVDADGTAYTLKAGQVAIIAPGCQHRLEPVDGGGERFTVGLTPKTLHLRQSMKEAVPVCKIFNPDRAFLTLCRKILDECASRRPYWQELARMELGQCAVLLLRLLGLQEEKVSAKRRQRDLTCDIIDNYFESNLAKDPGADDLAAKLHMSRRHLGRILQEIYGMGFREKLLKARMEQAAWLLRHTDKSVSVIAGEVGYTYDSAFRQAFRQRYEMTPQQYRQQKGKNR